MTTKLDPERLEARDVFSQVEESLGDLRCDHVDLLLIHWPSPAGTPVAETLGAMRDMQEAGRARHLGVSNFPTALLREALEHAPLVADERGRIAGLERGERFFDPGNWAPDWD